MVQRMAIVDEDLERLKASLVLSDVVQQRRMIDTGEAEEQYKRVSRGKLDALLGLCETPTCRRARLLNYFGEPQAPDYRCGNCDNCLEPPETIDGTTLARMALSAVYRTGQRFGVGYLVDVLTGKSDPRIARNGHDRLSVWNIGHETPATEWRALFRQLVAAGHLVPDAEGHGTLSLSETARPLLRGEDCVDIGERAPIAEIGARMLLRILRRLSSQFRHRPRPAFFAVIRVSV